MALSTAIAKLKLIFLTSNSHRSSRKEARLTCRTYLGTCKYSILPDITVCETGVRKLLEAVKPHKATGPDAIPARLLKDYAAEIAPVLTFIYQASLDQGTVLVDWKHAWVIPVYKKGDRGSPSNYKPISLTSISCKTLEHIIYSNFMDHQHTN